MTNDDMDLVRKYTAQNSQEAFAELVSRHIHLVHSAALRQVRNPHMAEEITQTVFVILARKAGSFGPKTILPGWLYRTAHYVSATALKIKHRRERREQEAYMQATQDGQDDSTWEELAPLLDGAMAKLREKDRNILVLRFFQNKTFREVGELTGMKERAAQKHAARALERLHGIFAKQGMVSTTVILAGVISANSVQAAPAALIKTATAVALTQGATASISTSTLIKGALKVMAWTKMKSIGIGIGVALLLASGTTTVMVKKLMAEQTIDESYWQPDTRALQNAPPVLIIRPTKTDGPNGRDIAMSGGRSLDLNASLAKLMSLAYGISESRMVLPANLPADHYDLMLTLTDHPQKALQAELKKRFGLSGHMETREAQDDLVMTISNPNAPGLVPSDDEQQTGNSMFVSYQMSASNSSGSAHAPVMNMPGNMMMRRDPPAHGGKNANGGNQMMMSNRTLAEFAQFLEQGLGQPVVDQTGTTNRFDIKLRIQPQPGESAPDALKRSVQEQLGLKLDSSNVPVEMFIVEKTR